MPPTLVRGAGPGSPGSRINSRVGLRWASSRSRNSSGSMAFLAKALRPPHLQEADDPHCLPSSDDHQRAAGNLFPKAARVSRLAPFLFVREGSLSFWGAPIGMSLAESRQALRTPKCLASQLDVSANARQD